MSTLAEYYTQLKNSNKVENNAPISDMQYKVLASKEANKLSADCAKRILLDIYCRVIPLDSDYVKGNLGVMKQDVDNFLATKDQNALQYFSSSYEKNSAPLLEFIIRSCKNIGQQFIEASNEALADAKKNDVKIPAPSADIDIVDKDSQLDDITGTDEKKGDDEFNAFIEKIKKKTINRIIDEVSDLIITKKDSKKNELKLNESVSTVGVAADYLNQKLWKEGTDLTDSQKEMITAMAIREATLNIIDSTLFSTDMAGYKSNIRFGKGVVVNEAAVNYIKEM